MNQHKLNMIKARIQGRMDALEFILKQGPDQHAKGKYDALKEVLEDLKLLEDESNRN